MGFLAPWFLAGAAAVGIPFYIHLLRQNKARPYSFASLMFLERRTESSLKQRRLRYLVLLAMRVALLLLLALAFANPYLTRAALPSRQGAKLFVIAIDDSFSMHQKGAWDKAHQDALDVVSAMKPADMGIVVSIGSQAHLLTQATGDKDALRAAINSAELGDGRGSLAEVARVARDIAKNAKLPVEVDFCSDLQQTALPSQFNDLDLAPGTKLVLHPAASAQRPNWYVEGVIAPMAVYSAQKQRIQATVGGAGTPQRSLSVSFVLNGRTLESKQAAVPANGRISVEFAAVEFPYGLNKGEIRIDSNDALPEDDHYWFSVERSESKRILFLGGGPGSRGETYYRAALDASPGNPFAVEPASASQALNAGLAKYSFIVLNDLGAWPPGLAEALTRMVRGGGSLLIVAGAQSATIGRIPVFDEPVLGTDYASRTGDRFETVASLDEEHPATRKTGHWDNVKFYQTVRVQPGNARILAHLGDGTPVLMEKKLGDGKVLLFASTFDNIANDFPVHASFVPFAEQTAAYLGGIVERQTRLPVDAYFDLRAGADQGSSAEVLGPDGKRVLSLSEAASTQTIPLPHAGFYEVRRSNGRQELLAVNADRRESDLALLPPDTLVLWQNAGQGTASTTGSASASRNISLWWYIVFALLLLALAESFMSSRFIPTEKES